MIHIERVQAIHITIQDEDINPFMNIINKLLVGTRQIDFKKPFEEGERRVIENIAYSLGIESPEDVRINVEKEQTKSDDYGY